MSVNLANPFLNQLFDSWFVGNVDDYHIAANPALGGVRG